MPESLDPKTPIIHTVIGPPSPPAMPTQSSQREDTNSGQVLDDDGTDIRTLFAPAQSVGEIGRLGHFRILKKLGAGGMGMVLLAEDVNLLRPVALKIMLPKYAKSAVAKERFLREARTAAKIHHDHVVTIFHVDEDRGIPFMAMEFLKGSALDEYLKEKAVSLGTALRIVREAAEGLSAAHRKGLIHRDIKPANMWLEAPKGRVKLLDFGLARDAADEVKLTQTGAVLGTPAYMSPEQANSEPVVPGSDLFSLGVVLYELVAGRLPFQGPSMPSLLYAIKYDPHVSMARLKPQTPAGVCSLIDQLLAKDPGGRPATARELVDALRRLETAKKRPDHPPAVEPIMMQEATSIVPDEVEDIDAGASEVAPRAPARRDARSSERLNTASRAA